MNEDHAKPTPVRRLLSISLITILITLIIIEVIIRIVPLYPDSFEVYDSERGWVYQAGKSGTYLSTRCLGEYSTQITINSHGLRDIERTYEKPPDTTRIFLLGDSTVASFEVPFESGLYRRTEAELSILSPDTTYEVLNGGHRGYGTDFEYLFYDQQASHYQSDLVILVFQINNDFGDNHPQLRSTEPEYYPSFVLHANNELELIPPTQSRTIIKQEARSINPIHNTFYTVSYLYRLIADRNYVRQVVQEGYVLQPEWVDETKTLTSALILKLQEGVKDDDALFSVVITPRQSQTKEENYTHLVSFLEANNIPYLDLDAMYKDLPESVYRLACDGHWTQQGHQMFGKAIADFAYSLLQES